MLVLDDKRQNSTKRFVKQNKRNEDKCLRLLQDSARLDMTECNEVEAQISEKMKTKYQTSSKRILDVFKGTHCKIYGKVEGQ